MSSSLWYYLLPWRSLLRVLGIHARPDGDYEQVLQSLSAKIESVQSRLAQVRQRERRARVTIPLFAMSFWMLYTAVAAWVGRLRTDDLGEAALWPIVLALGQGASLRSAAAYWLPTLLIPLAVACSRTPVQWWYGRVHAAEEKHLAALVRKRRNKIEEIKRVTNYDHLRLLLDRYDDTRQKHPVGPGRPSAPAAPAASAASAAPVDPTRKAPAGENEPPTQRKAGRQSMPAPSSRPSSLAPPMPVQHPSQLGVGTPGSNQSLRTQRSASTPWGPNGPATARTGSGPRLPSIAVPDNTSPEESVFPNANLAAHQGFDHAQPPRPMDYPPPPQRRLMDKLADAILGPDPTLRAPGPEQRYALICRTCCHHNGLAWKGDWDEIQYICPHCGEFNSNRPSTVPVSWPTMPLSPRKSVSKLKSPSPSTKSTLPGQTAEDDATSEDTPPSDTTECKPTSRPSSTKPTNLGSTKRADGRNENASTPQVAESNFAASPRQADATTLGAPETKSTSLEEETAPSVRHRIPSTQDDADTFPPHSSDVASTTASR